MAKLTKEKAKAVNDAEGQSFEPIPGGRYIVELQEVKADGNGPKGPYWTWIFGVVGVGDGAAFAGRKLFLNTSLSQDWAVKAPFEALGFGAETDTDEMISELCAATVSQREIQEGPKKGQMTNNVDGVSPLNEEDQALIASSDIVEGGGEDDVF